MTPAPFEDKIMYVNVTPLVRAWLVRHRLPHLGSRWLPASENSRPADIFFNLCRSQLGSPPLLLALAVFTWPNLISQSSLAMYNCVTILCSDSAGCNLTSTCVYIYIYICIYIHIYIYTLIYIYMFHDVSMLCSWRRLNQITEGHTELDIGP